MGSSEQTQKYRVSMDTKIARALIILLKATVDLQVGWIGAPCLGDSGLRVMGVLSTKPLQGQLQESARSHLGGRL